MNCDKLGMEFGAELAKRLDDIDVDQVWGEPAELDASKNHEAQKLAGPLHHAAQSGYKGLCASSSSHNANVTSMLPRLMVIAYQFASPICAPIGF